MVIYAELHSQFCCYKVMYEGEKVFLETRLDRAISVHVYVCDIY